MQIGRAVGKENKYTVFTEKEHQQTFQLSVEPLDSRTAVGPPYRRPTNTVFFLLLVISLA